MAKARVALLILLFFISTGYLQIQQLKYDASKGKLSFTFNRKPDSILINGISIPVVEKRSILVDTGNVTIEGFLKGFQKFSKTLHVESIKVKNIPLEFIHYTTPEYDSFRKLKMYNYLFSGGAVAIGALVSGGVGLLPFAGLNAAGQIFWSQDEAKKYQPGSRAYIGNISGKKDWSVYVLLNGKTEGQYAQEMVFDQDIQTNTYLIKIFHNTASRVTIFPSDKFFNNIELNLGIQKYFNSDFYLDGSIVLGQIEGIHRYYEKNSTYQVLKSGARGKIDASFGDPKSVSSKSIFRYQLKLGMAYKVISAQNGFWAFRAGGFWGPEIKFNFEYPVGTPSTNYFIENPIRSNLNSTFANTGIFSGIEALYKLNRHHSFLFRYDVVYGFRGVLNNHSFSPGIYFIFGTGFVFDIL